MLEKIPQIKLDITRNDEHWESWGFDEMLTELRKWLKRNYSSKESGVVSDPNLMKKSKSFWQQPKPNQSQDALSAQNSTGLISVMS